MITCYWLKLPYKNLLHFHQNFFNLKNINFKETFLLCTINSKKILRQIFIFFCLKKIILKQMMSGLNTHIKSLSTFKSRYIFMLTKFSFLFFFIVAITYTATYSCFMGISFYKCHCLKSCFCCKRCVTSMLINSLFGFLCSWLHRCCSGYAFCGVLEQACTKFCQPMDGAK